MRSCAMNSPMEHKTPHIWPTISAALIVRNEARFLEGCLTALTGQVNEIVVVDTGSADATAAIAKKHAVKLLHHRWTGDFSEARNVAVEAATGEWILYIDADERLLLPEKTKLSSFLSNPRAAAAWVQFMPKTGFTRYRELRLFRNRPDIRFKGRIHETVMADVKRVCDESGLLVIMTAVKIDHLGYDGSQDHKHARNLPLLESAIAEGQTRVYYYYHLAETLVALGRIEDARRAGHAGLETVRTNDSEKNRADASLIYQMLARIEPPGEATLELVREGMAQFPLDHALRFQLAEQLAQLDRHAEALSHLEVLRGVDPDALGDGLLAFDRRIFGAFAWQLTGSCLMSMGRQPEALLAFRAAAG